jgi:hypothetical protein
MITDDQMDAALNYLADDETAARVTFNLAVAENKVARTFADCFLFYDGSVEVRKMSATIHIDYQDALAEEADARAELARHRARCNHADKIVDAWRTQNANIRNAERVR